MKKSYTSKSIKFLNSDPTILIRLVEILREAMRDGKISFEDAPQVIELLQLILQGIDVVMSGTCDAGPSITEPVSIEDLKQLKLSL